ncbi:uncharacterized protein LOC129000450 [Macrosteles quadrilineatus]|uniref:uncharacterized protein LOC129000450 n=1 Tax=Macrosteles quadrilineatus TaxID=74068 RepID=UPI0023E32E99|nr:uncharacterized protein LOC129000450 [Macrosteles quadrilineatus]
MKLVDVFVGIIQIVGVFSTLIGKDKLHSKQFTLSCTGMDYSYRQQKLLQNNEVPQNTFKGLYPEGQEVLYSYSAVVTTGTKSPAPFVSQFNLTGNIKVQGFKNRARVQFVNLKFVSYSGDVAAEKKLKISKLPDNAATLYQPFDIYYKDGQVSKLEMSSETPMWSRSIKQAVSGILQFDLPKINIEEYSAFLSTEQNIHGLCAVLNSVKPHKNKLHITKFYNTRDCLGDTVEWSNVETEPGCLNFNPLTNNLESTSQKTYRVTPYGEDTLLIREVFTEGKTYRFLRGNSNSSHYITVSQKLQLVSMNGITRVVDIPNPEEIHSLEFKSGQFDSFKFSTNEDLNKVVKKVQHLLPTVRSQLEGINSLLSEQIGAQEPHLVPLVITYLRKLDIGLLQQLYDELEKNNDIKSIDMLIKILPLVGSQDSALFLVNLVEEYKVNDYEAELLISSLPIHLRQLSEEHLSKFEGLLNLPGQTKTDVRNAAILSFATLIYETCKSGRCNPETINKYTLQFIENSKEYLNQLVYLAGLSNLHLENLVGIVEPLISGEDPVSSETVKVFGLRAVFPVVAANPDKAYKIYWPVIINPDNTLELRATALALLMEAQQELSVFTQLHQTMTVDECNSHLHNIYYKLIKSYSEDKQHCHSTRKHIAQQIMRTMKKPVISEIASSFYEFSVADGKLRVLSVVGSVPEHGSSAYITYSSNCDENPITYYSIYIKLKGVKIEMLNDILQTIVHPSKAADILVKLIQHDLIPENFQLELILLYQQQVVSLRNYDKDNIDGLLKDLINTFQSQNILNLSVLHASSFFNKETFFVTDIGFPGVVSLDYPNIFSFKAEKSSSASTQDVNFDLRYWSQGSAVLKIKNTMVDIWQGIINSHSSRFNLPLHLEIKLSDHIYVTLKPALDKENNHVGFKWHTQTDIFTVTNSENYDALSVSCNNCKPLSSVKGKTSQTVENKLDNLCYSLHSKIFDCEDDGSTNLLRSTPGFEATNLLNTLGTSLSAGLFLQKYLLGLPISGSCGYSTVYTPSQEYSVCIKSLQQINNVTIMIGNSISEERCAPNIMEISLSLDGSIEGSYDKEELMGQF